MFVLISYISSSLPAAADPQPYREKASRVLYEIPKRFIRSVEFLEMCDPWFFHTVAFCVSTFKSHADLLTVFQQAVLSPGQQNLKRERFLQALAVQKASCVFTQSWRRQNLVEYLDCMFVLSFEKLPAGILK